MDQATHNKIVSFIWGNADLRRRLFEPPTTSGRGAVGGGAPRNIEYEPDADLRDTEQIRLHRDAGIEAFNRREVLPCAPDAWIKEDATKIGNEISFSRHFDKPQPLRTPEAISADILAVEKEAEGLLGGPWKAGKV